MPGLGRGKSREMPGVGARRAASLTYQQKIQGLFGAALIGYWQMDDKTGVTALDSSGNSRNGTYRNTAGVLNGVTLGQTGIGDGKTSALFDGTNGYCNIYSADLAAAFSGTEGSLILWAKAGDIFADGVSREPIMLRADVNNRIFIEKNTSNAWNFAFIAGGTPNYRQMTNTSDWTMLAIVWSRSANKVRFYQNGNRIGADDIACPLWAGSLIATNTIIGAGSTTPASLWKGNIAHVMLLNRAATPEEVLLAYTSNP